MEYSKMLSSLATIMKQKLDVVTPLVYFAFTFQLQADQSVRAFYLSYTHAGNPGLHGWPKVPALPQHKTPDATVS